LKGQFVASGLKGGRVEHGFSRSHRNRGGESGERGGEMEQSGNKYSRKTVGGKKARGDAKKTKPQQGGNG